MTKTIKPLHCLIAIMSLAYVAVGCATTNQNVRTVTVEACSAAEDWIVSRDDTTYEQDREDLDKTRAACNLLYEVTELPEGDK